MFRCFQMIKTNSCSLKNYKLFNTVNISITPFLWHNVLMTHLKVSDGTDAVTQRCPSPSCCCCRLPTFHPVQALETYRTVFHHSSCTLLFLAITSCSLFTDGALGPLFLLF
ncbi:hypothetical protein CHARACLAT_015877 [Characodon lateralis]|uniref:Uncharacterized protein n=1 Tax=Characodon lateralis TaxID=208331 RepID=A0ABU7EU17_9TELE|nr:hypothetical protein [Characodon lateralis]